jgi:4-hydroxy-tetrahydrodipicolinate synthase
LVTPFEPDTGKIDFPSLRKLLQFHVASGTDNLCILGTTGEASVLTMQEREQVLKVTVDEVKGKMPILVGTGTINPASVKDMTQQALDCGCDASLVVTPYYVKPPQRCLIQHFTDAAYYGLPVVIYNVPGRTAVDMKDESIAIAALHENIVAVKDATGNLARVKGLRAELEKLNVENFLLFSGDDSTSIDFVLEGGDGCISVTANVAANAMHRLIVAARQGDAEAAASINDPLKPLHTKLFCESNPIPVKWAVARMGLIVSAYCRPPLDFMDPVFESDVETALRQAGLLED